MNRQFGLAGQQRGFEFLREKSFRQFATGERRGLKFVAGGLDDDDFKGLLWKCGTALGENPVGLGECQRAASRGDTHGSGDGMDDRIHKSGFFAVFSGERGQVGSSKFKAQSSREAPRLMLQVPKRPALSALDCGSFRFLGVFLGFSRTEASFARAHAALGRRLLLESLSFP